MNTSLTRFGALLLAAAVLTGACSEGGGEKEAADNPQQAFSDAVDALGEYEGVTFVLTLEADAADLTSNEVPEDAAEAILNSSLTISAKGTTPEDSQLEMTTDIDGNEDAVQIRILGSSFYARADVRELVEAFDGDVAEVDTAVEQASAAGFDFAQAAVDGEWVGVEGLDELAEQFGVPPTTPDPEQAAALADRVVAILDENASVTSEGTDDTGAHLVVTVPLQETSDELLDALQSFGGAAAAGALPAAGLEDLPDADIPIDVWVSDGRLVQIEFDFIAIAQELGEEPPEGVDDLALRMTVDEFDDEVEAPEDFEAIDLQQILQGVFGATMGGLDSGSGGAGGDDDTFIPELGIACSDLGMLTPAQIEQALASQPGALEKVEAACPELF